MIKVEIEPDDVKEGGVERCVFCRDRTEYWTSPVTGDSIACCRLCAKEANPADLPTKKQWFRRETIATRGRRKFG